MESGGPLAILPAMTPRQWGTVLFTVMGIVLIATGVILGVTILAQVGGDMPGGFFWRFLMFFAVPIGGGFALLMLRETLATMYLRDEPVQPSAMTARDAVRVAIVIYGVWLMVETTLGFVLSLVTGGHGGGLMDQISGTSWFRALLGRLVQFAAGFVLATQAEAIAELVWRSPPRAGGDAPRP